MNVKVQSIRCLLVITACALGVASSAQADAANGRRYHQQALRKLGRGGANVITSPLEIIHQSKRSHHKDGWVAGQTVGVANGVAWMGARILVGIFEIVTFPLPVNDFEPLLQPEFLNRYDDWLADQDGS